MFTVADAETAATGLTVTASSSNTTLVPMQISRSEGPGQAAQSTSSPVANQSGVTTITVNVSDGTSSTPRTFSVTVTVLLNDRSDDYSNSKSDRD